MKVARMPVRMLEPEFAFAEVHAPRDAGVHHPLQRAVDRGATDPLVFAMYEVDQVIRRDVSLLAEEHVDDEVALARSPATSRAQLLDELGGRRDGHRPRPRTTIRSRRSTWRSGS